MDENDFLVEVFMNKSQARKILGIRLNETETAGIESTNLKIDELLERYGKEGL